MFPYNGLNTASAGSKQPRNTTVYAVNCRPFDVTTGIRRGARRAGLTKYMASKIADASIQDITSAVITLDQTAGTGELFSQAKVSSGPDSVAFFAKTNGAETASGTTLVSTKTMGCVDEDGNFYVAAAFTNGVRLYKFGTDHVLKWTRDLSIPGSGYVWGLAAFAGVLYIYLTDDFTAGGLYHVETENGSNLSPGVWLNAASNGLAGIAALSVGQAGYQKCFNCISIGGNILGLVGGKAGNLVLQQIDVTSGTIVHETILETFATFPSKIVNDSGGNFYVLTNVDGAGGVGAVNRLIKVTWSGALDTTWLTNPIVSTGAGAKDIAYEPVAFRVLMVGNALFGGTDSLQIRDANSGTKLTLTAGLEQPNAQTTWAAVAADGFANFRIRRSAAANDVASFSQGSATAIWTKSSSLGGTTTETLWEACPGVNVVSSGTPMKSQRLTRFLAVAGGSLKRFDGGIVRSLATAFCSGSAPVVFSTRNVAPPATEVGVAIYYTDGSNYPYYNATTNTTGFLTASAGAVPASPNGGKCRLCCTYGGRHTLSGLLRDPQLVFLSAIGNPQDWNYGRFPTVATQAVAAQPGSQLGECPDLVNALLPYNDDLLILLCDESIYMLSGNPAQGGQFDRVAKGIGGAFGRPFCMDPSGNMYFFSSRGSIYTMAPGSRPRRISAAIDSERFFDLNLDDHIVRMAWDDRWRGMHIFITPIDPSAGTMNYWWDGETDQPTAFTVVNNPGSWWPDRFARSIYNPMAVHVFDGDDPGDRTTMIGCRDGYIRSFDNMAEDDDGAVIESEVWVGPIVADGNAFWLTDFQVTLSRLSSSLKYTVHIAESVEEAQYADAFDVEGELSAGRNLSQAIRCRGHAAFIRLFGNERAVAWAVEEMRVQVMAIPGRVAQRSW